MTFKRITLAAFVSAGLLCGTPALAATTTRTTVTHGTSVNHGVVSHRTRIVKVRKHKTRRSRRVLGVKVGHHTATTRTVRTTTHRSNGTTSTTVRTTH